MKKVETLKEVQTLVAAGREKGFLTHDDINDALPAAVNDKESIDAVLAILASHAIPIIDWAQ